MTCDCCDRERELTRCWAFGIETFACDECRGNLFPTTEEILSRGPRNGIGDRPGIEINTKRNKWGWQ